MAGNLPPLDPAAHALAEHMAKAKPMHESTVEEARAMAAAVTKLTGHGPEVEQVSTIQIEASDGVKRKARLYVPLAPAGYLIYYHGGGWVLGDLDGFDALARSLASESGWTVVLPDYRLAPENPYPAAVLDAEAALRWARRKAEIAGLPVAVAGDSAGGNLAAVVALRARNRSEPLAAQLLVYPVLDHGGGGSSYDDPETQILLTTPGMNWFWDHYASEAEARRHPDASPSRATSLEGLAPALVITAGYDPLRDEGEAYAARLAHAGVPVVFRRFADQPHGFFSLLSLLPAAEVARAFFVAALKFLIDQMAVPFSSAHAAPRKG